MGYLLTGELVMVVEERFDRRGSRPGLFMELCYISVMLFISVYLVWLTGFPYVAYSFICRFMECL